MADMPEVSQPPPHPLDSEWETLFGDKTYGPYTGHRIKAFIAEGRVTAETQVRIVGTEAWGGAGNADGLAPLFHNPAHTVGMGIRNAGDSFGKAYP